MSAASMAASSGLNTCDGKPLHLYAAKAPVMKAVKGSSSVVDHGRLQRESLMLIVDKLMKYPNFIGQIHNIFFSADFAIPEEWSTLQDETFTGKYSTIDKIGKGWLAKWLLQRGKAGGLTSDMLVQVDKVDPDAIHTLMSYELQLPMKCGFPKLLTSALACTQVFNERANCVGSRLKDFCQAGGIVGDKLDFITCGCYGLTFEGDRCTQVRHVSGMLACVPQHVTITRSFDLFDNWSDMEARVELLPSKYYLYTLFDKECGFLKDMPKESDKKGTKLFAGLAVKGMERVKKHHQDEVEASVVGTNVLKENEDMRRQLTTAKARDAMDARRLQRGDKRKVNLATSSMLALPAPPVDPATPPAKRAAVGDADGERSAAKALEDVVPDKAVDEAEGDGELSGDEQQEERVEAGIDDDNRQAE